MIIPNIWKHKKCSKAPHVSTRFRPRPALEVERGLLMSWARHGPCRETRQRQAARSAPVVSPVATTATLLCHECTVHHIPWPTNVRPPANSVGATSMMQPAQNSGWSHLSHDTEPCLSSDWSASRTPSACAWTISIWTKNHVAQHPGTAWWGRPTTSVLTLSVLGSQTLIANQCTNERMWSTWLLQLQHSSCGFSTNEPTEVPCQIHIQWKRSAADLPTMHRPGTPCQRSSGALAPVAVPHPECCHVLTGRSVLPQPRGEHRPGNATVSRLLSIEHVVAMWAKNPVYGPNLHTWQPRQPDCCAKWSMHHGEISPVSASDGQAPWPPRPSHYPAVPVIPTPNSKGQRWPNWPWASLFPE